MAWVPVGNVKGPQGDAGTPGTTTWAGITDKPAYIGAGTSAANARAAIGAGTSNLAIGTASTDAMAGNRIWIGTLASRPGTGTTGVVYFTY